MGSQNVSWRKADSILGASSLKSFWISLGGHLYSLVFDSRKESGLESRLSCLLYCGKVILVVQVRRLTRKPRKKVYVERTGNRQDKQKNSGGPERETG